MIGIVVATLIGNIITTLYMVIVNVDFPRSIYIMVPILDIILMWSSRFFYRISEQKRLGFIGNENCKKVLIIGAGAAGSMLLKEFKNNRDLKIIPVAFIDDNIEKKGTRINKIPVVGNRNDIVNISKKFKIDEIIIAIPSIKDEEKKQILNECNKTKCTIRILPGIYEMIDGRIDTNKIRNVEIEDLLGRDEIHLELDKLSTFIAGKRVMVTGGGGSIGFELCRQISNIILVN